MAAPRLPIDDPETPATLQKIRELVAKVGVNETARRMNRSRSNVSEINSGIRYRRLNNRQLTVEQLGIRRGSGKLCRKCGNPCWLVIIKSVICVECYLLELIQLGVIKVPPATGEESNGSSSESA